MIRYWCELVIMISDKFTHRIYNRIACQLLIKECITKMKRINHEDLIQQTKQQEKQNNPTKFSTLAPYIKEIQRIKRQKKLNKTHSSRSNPHHNAASIRRIFNQNQSLTSSTQFRIKDIGTAKLYLQKFKQDKRQVKTNQQTQKTPVNKNIVKSEFQRSKTVHSTLTNKSKVNKFISFMHKKFKQANHQNNFQTIQEKQQDKTPLHGKVDKPLKLTINDNSQRKQVQVKRFNSDFSKSAKNVNSPNSERVVNKISQKSKSFKTVHKGNKVISGVSSQRQINSKRRFPQQFSSKTSKGNSKGNSSFQTLENTAKLIKNEQGKIIETVIQHSKQRKVRNNFRKNKFQEQFSRPLTPMLTGLNNKEEYPKVQNFLYVRKDEGLVIGITNEEIQKYSLTKQELRYRKIRNKQFNVSVEKSTEKYLQQQPYRSLKSNNDIQFYVSTVTNPSVIKANKSDEDAFPIKVSTNANSNTVQKQMENNQQKTNKSKNKSNRNDLQGVLNYDFQFQDQKAQAYDSYGKADSSNEQGQEWINFKKHIRQDDSDVHIDDLREHIGSP